MGFLNCIISGSKMRLKYKTPSHFTLLHSIIKNSLRENIIPGMDGFMSSTIRAFINNTKHIDLNTRWLQKFREYETAKLKIHPISLLMHDIKNYILAGDNITPDDYTNLFRLELLQLFKNVDTVHIFISVAYRINFIALLKLMKLSGLKTIVIKSCVYNQDVREAWAIKAWDANHNAWNEQYRNEGYKVTCEKIIKSDMCKVWHIIKKQD